MNLKVTCIRDHANKVIKVGETYSIIDADMGEYLIKINEREEVWISKNDIEHFKYNV